MQLSLPLKLPDVGINTERRISRNLYFTSKTHAAHYGPGQPAPCIPHTRKVVIDQSKLEEVMKYLMSADNVQRLACGSTELILSSGEVLIVPAVARLALREHMWSDFKKNNCDANGVYIGRISRTDFLSTVNCATSSQQKPYAALDQIKVLLLCMTWGMMVLFCMVWSMILSFLQTIENLLFVYIYHSQVRCGTENFANGRTLLKSLASMDPIVFAGYEQYLLPLLERYQEHCKTGLPKHISKTSTVAAHCARHLFGGQRHFSEECGPECEGHAQRCKECDAGRVFIYVLKTMVTKLKSNGALSGNHLEDVEWQIDQFKCKHDKYVAHLIRGIWEINNKKNIFRNLPVGHVIEVQDWKMKFIMLLFREVCHDMCSCMHGKNDRPGITAA